MQNYVNRGPRATAVAWGGSVTQNTRTLDRFQYFAEDCDCRYCRYFISKKHALSQAALAGRAAVCGCTQTVCVCEDVRQNAISAGRIKRSRGWNRRWDKE
jgi:hypothetical protein